MKGLMISSGILMSLDSFFMMLFSLIKGKSLASLVSKFKLPNNRMVYAIVAINMIDLLIITICSLFYYYQTFYEISGLNSQVDKSIRQSAIYYMILNIFIQVIPANGIPSLFAIICKLIANHLNQLSVNFISSRLFAKSDTQRLVELRYKLMELTDDLKHLESLFSPSILLSISISILLSMAHICIISVIDEPAFYIASILMVIMCIIKIQVYCYFGQEIVKYFEHLANILEVESIERRWKVEELVQYQSIISMRPNMILKASGFIDLKNISAATLALFVLQYAVILIQTESQVK
jgi:hypothetical protein